MRGALPDGRASETTPLDRNESAPACAAILLQSRESLARSTHVLLRIPSCAESRDADQQSAETLTGAYANHESLVRPATHSGERPGPQSHPRPPAAGGPSAR